MEKIYLLKFDNFTHAVNLRNWREFRKRVTHFATLWRCLPCPGPTTTRRRSRGSTGETRIGLQRMFLTPLLFFRICNGILVCETLFSIQSTPFLSGLSWIAVSGCEYQIQSSSDLQIWTDVGPRQSTSESMEILSFKDEAYDFLTDRFYRIVIFKL